MDQIRKKIAEIPLQQSLKQVSISESTLKATHLKNIQLRSYQIDGVSWLVGRYYRQHGCILGDEMGLGKTCQTIAFLLYLKAAESPDTPFLVLSPLSVLNNWQNELKRFAPSLKVISYVGSKEYRENLRKTISVNKYHIVLSTYEICLKDLSFLGRYSWHTLVVDEAHRLKNSNSLLYQTLKDFEVGHQVLLTGTPVQNNLKELYSLLNFVAPKIFKVRYEKEFLEEFSSVSMDKDLQIELHTLLQPFLLRRVKSEVVKDLPKKSEVIITHGLSELQKKYYKAILMKDIDAFQDPSSVGPNRTRLVNILVQLRKCVSHPYMFDGVEPEPFELGEHLVEASGKLAVLDKLLVYLRPRGHRVLLFSQMTHMLDIVQDYLGYRGFTYERLDGSVRGEERFLAVQNFNDKPDETFVFLLSTRAGGQGLNLATADTVIFLDSDFNPQNDLQAAARAHRIGQTRPVKVIRLVGKDTVEEVIQRRADHKLRLTKTVIEGGQLSSGGAATTGLPDSPTQLSQLLKFGLEALLGSNGATASCLQSLDLDRMLGSSVNGEWAASAKQVPAPRTAAEPPHASESAGDQTETEDNFYLFEGKDYSKEASSADKKIFDDLVKVELELLEHSGNQPRLTKRNRTTSHLAFPTVPNKKRKQLTPEEVEERKKKRLELAKTREKQMEERAKKRAERERLEKEEIWRTHSYVSANISLETDEEESGEEEEDDRIDDGIRGVSFDAQSINYVMGDVTQPIDTKYNTIIVHCVDDSGCWGSGGLFSAISSHSNLPEQQYELAGKVKDLKLGDCHLIPMKSGSNSEVALIVAQHRGNRGNLSGVQLDSLNCGLQKIYKMAKKHRASVHLPRIGHSTPGFNWYGTERLIKKCLVSKGIPSYIYYFPRRKKDKEKLQEKDSLPVTDKKDVTKNLIATRKSWLHLPDFMSGTYIYFHDIPEEIQKKLARFVIAFNGDIEKSITSRTTHVVAHSSAKQKSMMEELRDGFSKAKIVSVGWLEDCLQQQNIH